MKSKVIIIYGPMGVGKLTIAKMLAYKTGFSLSHNHLVYNLVRSLFERDSLGMDNLTNTIRTMLYEKAVEANKNFIITHAYAHNYSSLTGQSDPEYLENLQTKITSAGGKAYFVHLKANDHVLLERVISESRRELDKLTDVEKMKEYLNTMDFQTSASLENQLVLDTSELSPEETLNNILNFIK